MKRVLLWIKDFWYIPLLAVGVLLAWLWFRPRGKDVVGVVTAIQKEIDAIRAGQKAREMLINQDEKTVAKAIQEKYKAKIEALDAEKRAKVAELENDPVAMAKLLERMTR